MQRGRRPKPTHLKIVTGNPGKRKLNDAEPQSGGPVGDPPKNWNASQRALWAEIVTMSPAGVLTESDRHIVELAVRLLAQIRGAKEVAPALATQFRTCLAELGMTPSARSRLSTAPRGGNANPWADFDD